MSHPITAIQCRPRLRLLRLPACPSRLVLAACILCCAQPARSQTLEVHELDANPDPHVGQTVTIQGRLQSAGAGRLQLVGSKLDIRYNEPRLPIRAGATHVEVTGRLARQQGSLVLDAQTITALPGEAAEFARRRERIAPGDFSALYDLSRWARARANWYGDTELRDLASQSYRQAFAREEQVLVRRGDWDGLLQLADRGEALRLEPDEVRRLRYRALVGKRENLPAHDASARLALAEQVRRLLPGTEQPGPPRDAQPAQRGAAEQIAQYAETPAQQRPGLHRALWAALVAEALELRAGEKEPDWFALARDAAGQLPERPELARRFELAGWRRRAAEPAGLTREELLASREGLKRLGQQDEAQALAGQWLKARRMALSDDDAEQRLALADDYLALLGDEQTAAELLREALASAPRFAEAEAGLRRLGFEQVGGVWRRVAELGADAAGAGAALVSPGASEADVLRRLRRPDRITRTASRNGIFEQWSYDGPPALVVYLERGVTGGSARVTRVVGR